ncbi:MAG: nickel-dependent hydrogenase large subunit [Alphaproteobacteria bacterium]|nr:nickel-dependent hydrogenase large subunit [Alphaproteobacteria bacterium]
MNVLASEGAIGARLILDGGRISAVEITPRPAPPLNLLMAGLGFREAAQRIPTLFSLCAMAQRDACLGALEAAFGISPPPAWEASRKLLVLAETLEEHARHLLLDGALLLGAVPDAEGAKRIRRHVKSLEKAIHPAPFVVKPEAAHLAGWLEELRGLVLERIMGGRDVSALSSFASLQDWGRGLPPVPALVLTRLQEHDRSAPPPATAVLMGGLDPVWLADMLRGDKLGRFTSRPATDEGICLETGPLSRQCDHPLIGAIEEELGCGLTARALARLIEISQAMVAMAMILPMLEPWELGQGPMGSGEGIGQSEAARGRLVHWVRVEESKINSYRLMAPTEWNFHPEGPFVKALLGAPARSPEAASHLARLQAYAFDPCVGLLIEVYDA